jgi:hypothetical protein
MPAKTRPERFRRPRTESGLQALSGVSLEFLRTGMLGRRPMGRVWVGSKATKVTASPFSFLSRGRCGFSGFTWLYATIPFSFSIGGGNVALLFS